MTSSGFSHQPVMFEEVMAVFEPISSGLIIDGTLGGGGHSDGLLSHAPGRCVLGIDRDPFAIEAASNRLSKYGERFAAVHRPFDQLGQALADSCRKNPLFCSSPLGLLLDLGVSSPQLEIGQRGFSYRAEGPLDMRMDTTQGKTLEQFLDSSTEQELIELFRENGEGRFAKRIARAILQGRPYSSTTELAEVVKNSIPAAARRTGGHPATRVFQALRIMVNDELERLKIALETAFRLILPGGRIAVLSYHSGEDSVVKRLFKEQAEKNCTCPSGLPCICGATVRAKYVVRSKVPSESEIVSNPRARSARLRAIEMLESDDDKGSDGVG